tara:strand:- start:60 stop:884 length:825 start_codon:yes stop_codon:yes gene_type:complete
MSNNLNLNFRQAFRNMDQIEHDRLQNMDPRYMNDTLQKRLYDGIGFGLELHYDNMNGIRIFLLKLQIGIFIMDEFISSMRTLYKEANDAIIKRDEKIEIIKSDLNDKLKNKNSFVNYRDMRLDVYENLMYNRAKFEISEAEKNAYAIIENHINYIINYYLTIINHEVSNSDNSVMNISIHELPTLGPDPAHEIAAIRRENLLNQESAALATALSGLNVVNDDTEPVSNANYIAGRQRIKSNIRIVPTKKGRRTHKKRRTKLRKRTKVRRQTKRK